MPGDIAALPAKSSKQKHQEKDSALRAAAGSPTGGPASDSCRTPGTRAAFDCTAVLVGACEARRPAGPGWAASIDAESQLRSRAATRGRRPSSAAGAPEPSRFARDCSGTRRSEECRAPPRELSDAWEDLAGATLPLRSPDTEHMGVSNRPPSETSPTGSDRLVMICGKERNGPSSGSDESVSRTTLLQAPGRSKAGTKTKVCA